MENYSNVYKHSQRQFSVKIDNMIYQKIMHWVDKAVGEVSGLGKLVIDPATGIIEIKSAILLTQENTGSTTDIDAAAVAKAMFELRNEPGDLNFWWHSHVNMGVFWSGTDVATIREIGEQGFCVATVFNKKREMKSCFFKKINDEFMPEMFVDDIPTTIYDSIPGELVAEWDVDFDAKCSVKKYETPVWNNNYRNQGHSHSDYWSRDWYDSFRTKADNKEFEEGRLYSVNDDGTPHDDIKIFAAETELLELKSQMEAQTEFGKAKVVLSKICAVINRLKLSDPNKSYAAKEPYLIAFRTKFPSLPSKAM